MKPGGVHRPFVPPGRKPLAPLAAAAGAEVDASAVAPAAAPAPRLPFRAPAPVAPRADAAPVAAPAPARPAAGGFAPPRPGFAAPRPGGAGAGAPSAAAAPSAEPDEFYTVTYCQRSNKKRKNRTYLDGVLQVKAGQVILFNDEGKKTASSWTKGCRGMPEGATVDVGNWEVEVSAPLDESRFLSGAIFMAPAAADGAAGTAAAPPPPRPGAAAAAAPFRAVAAPGAAAGAAAQQARPAPPPRHAQPVHDPSAPGALVLCTPGDTRFGAPGRAAAASVAVVVDPYISSRLRPHQREGVAFMFECVMGARGPHTGCLLADAMGVGKTIQVLALLWTLLRQSPGGGGVPTVRRAVVVCPASLVSNWRAEAQKWLGVERLGVMVVQGGGAAAKACAENWANKAQTKWPLLIVGYEALRNCAAEVAAGAPGILICDEAHRLKSAGGSKTLTALLQLGTKRRVLLTGTPVQNNMEEFYSMMDFATPGLLGDLAQFRRLFAAPIEASRDAAAPPEAKRIGAERAAQLKRCVEPFMLRRTADVNTQYLPPRQDYVVFCRPSAAQHALYTAFLKLPETRAMLTCSGGGALSPLLAITLLRRLCASPAALLGASPAAEELDDGGDAAAAAAPAATSDDAARVVAQLRAAVPLPPDVTAPDADAAAQAVASGKMAALAAILRHVARCPGDRIVVVAGWTSTLNAVAALCDALALRSCRLDGSTAVDSRGELVRRFNAGAAGSVFLLSTRAGGVGLNLVGANRLVLFDSDWNPAHDLQAMGRVWRDGQRKRVAIYRLLTTGTIEEKIYQRQVLKGEMAALVQSESASRHFSAEELRRLFAFRPDAAGGCETAELLAAGAAGAAWVDASAGVADAPLADAVAAGVVSFVHAPPAIGSAAAMAAATAAAEAEAAAEQTDAEAEAEADALRAIAGDLDDEDDVEDDVAVQAAAGARRKLDAGSGGAAGGDWMLDDDDDA